MFPVRYELNFYIVFRRNSVSEWFINHRKITKDATWGNIWFSRHRMCEVSISLSLQFFCMVCENVFDWRLFVCLVLRCVCA
jgi:hypothetical protein